MTEIADVHKSRIANLESWKEAGKEPYANKVKVTHHAGELQDKYADIEAGHETGDEVTVAGRIMSVRNNGMFIDLQDHTGKIQIFSHKQSLSPDYMETLKLYDLGDIITVTGKVRRTPRDELTINSEHIQLLSKSLQPLPEKHHGMTDVELRYRKRHIDLSDNEISRDVFIKRSKIITAIRQTMLDEDFLEVETPMMHPIPGGAVAKPFITHHNALDQDLYLRIAPELYLKRLIVGGISDKIFEIGRCFRNEGLSPKHNPEFTSIEVYQAHADYEDMMDLTEKTVQAAVRAVHDGSTKVTFKEQEIDFGGNWPRKSMTELVKDKTGVDFLEITDASEAIKKGRALGLDVPDGSNWGQVVAIAFDEKVESTLIQPIHVTDLPLDISPLAKAKPDNPLLTERFESFVNGWEIANAFSELNDPFDQYRRFKAQSEQKDAGDDEAHHFDEDFIETLEFGMPPTGGLGIGLDRLVMLLTDSHNIRDVIAFPTMRPAAAASIVTKMDGKS